MDDLSFLSDLAALILPVLFSITLHEAAHGYVARLCGDNTAYAQGRVTLNPIPHIDPVGTVAVPAILFFTSHLLAGSGMLFGWAKPVPVNGRNLHNPRRDMALVAIAGPGANLIMALMWALIMRAGFLLGEPNAWFAIPMIHMGQQGVLINAVLMVLNLIPILPLDGGRVLNSLLPARLAMQYARLEPWGMAIVLVLFFTGILAAVMGPGIRIVYHLSLTLVGLN